MFTILKKGSFRRRLAGPLHRIFRASPYSCSGASNDVTHCRRKYHHACIRFVARCFAIAALRRWPSSLRPPGVLPPFAGDVPCVPAVRLRAYRMYLIALFTCIAGHFRPAGTHPLLVMRSCRRENQSMKKSSGGSLKRKEKIADSMAVSAW